jgi:hypothetical protein
MWELRPGLYHLIVDARFQFNHPVKRRLGAEVPPFCARQIAVLSIRGFRFVFPIRMLCLWQFTRLLWEHNGLRLDNIQSPRLFTTANLLRAIAMQRSSGHA